MKFNLRFGWIVTSLLVMSLAGSAAQQQNSEHTLRLGADEAKPEAKLEVASWLTGYWQGEGLGGRIEEVWSEPQGSSMMGMFRLIQNGETVFYELMQLIETEGTLHLRVKHFNLDFTGWEEKDKFVTFPLAKVENERLFFNGLTLEKTGKDGLSIYIVLRRGDERTEEKISLRRISS